MALISFDQFYNTAVQGQAKNSTIKLNGNNGVKTTGWPTWKSTNRAAIDGFLESITASYGQECSDIIRGSLDMRAKPKPLKARQIIEIKTLIDEIQKNFQALDAYFNPEVIGDTSPAEDYLDSLLSEYEQQANFSFGQLYEQKKDILENVHITLTENIQNHQAFSEEDVKACIRQELQSHLPQIYMEKFFAQGMNDEPSPAEAYLDDLLNNTKPNNDCPQKQLDYLKLTVIRMVKKELTEKIQKHKTFSPNTIKQLLAEELNTLYKYINGAFSLSRQETGKSWNHELLRCLSSFSLNEPSQYSLMANFLSDVVQTSGNNTILDGSLDNSKQLYEELCSRLGDTPEDLATEQSIDTINDKIAQKLQQLQRKNQKLGNQLKSLSQSFKPNASLETLAPELRPFHQACLNAIDQLLQKRPDLKDFFPEFHNEQDIANFVKNNNEASLVISSATNLISKQPKIVTADVFSELVQQAIMDRLFDKYAKQEIQQTILPTLNPPADLPDSFMDINIIQTIATVPKALKASFCSLSQTSEQLQETKQTILDYMKKKFSVIYTSNLATDTTDKYMKEAIQNNCILYDEEMATIDTRKPRGAFNIITSALQKEISDKGEEPQLQVFMEALKKRADEFIALKTELIKNIESLQGKLPRDIYKKMRAHIIECPDYIYADMPLRAYEIAKSLNVSLIEELGRQPSKQDIMEAFVHLATQVNSLKTKEELRYEPFERREFTVAIFDIACSLHPKLLDTMYQVSEDVREEIHDTFLADIKQLGDDVLKPTSSQNESDSLRLEFNTIKDADFYSTYLYDLATEKHQSEVNVQ